MANLRMRRRRTEGGATLVEFALLSPLIFALLLGMFTGGLSLSRKNSMTNAVREAARFGATVQSSTTWANTVRARAVELSGGDLVAEQVCVELMKRDTSGPDISLRSSSPACSLPASAKPSSTNIPNGDCAVKVWASRPTDFSVIFFSRNIELTSGSINLYERACT